MKLLKQINRITGRRAPGLLGELDVTTRPDANLHDQVMTSDTSRRQVSIMSIVDDPAPLIDATAVAAWQRGIGGNPEARFPTERMDGLRAAWIADSTTDGVAPVMGAMFGPSEDPSTAKAELKDITELQTRLTVQGPRVYETAAQVGISAHPASEAELAARSVTVLAGADDMITTGTLNELSAITLNPTAHHIVAYGPSGDDAPVSHSLFVIDTSTPGLEEAVDDLMGTWDLPVPLSRCRFFRPFTSQAVAEEAAAEVPGRTWTILDATGGAGTDGLVAGFLDPRARLHLRRKWGQQETMLLSSLGLGVAGWQNTKVTRGLIDDLNDVAEIDKYSGRTRKGVRS